MYVYVCETYQLNARKVATASTTLFVPVNWLAVYAGPNMFLCMFVCMYVYICIGVRMYVCIQECIYGCMYYTSNGFLAT